MLHEAITPMLDTRGRMTAALSVPEALFQASWFIQDNPRLYDHRYFAVPGSCHTLMPTDALGWVSFYLKLTNPEKAAELVTGQAKVEAFYSLAETMVSARGKRGWTDRPIAVAAALQGLAHRLNEIYYRKHVA